MRECERFGALTPMQMNYALMPGHIGIRDDGKELTRLLQNF
jgi:hypothetical protein